MADGNNSCVCGDVTNSNTSIISSDSSNSSDNNDDVASSKSDDSGSSGWDENMTDDPMGDDDSLLPSSNVKCLFCPEVFQSVERAVEHCCVSHEFDLLSLKKKLDMDCYSYIKMINYIRIFNPDVKTLLHNVNTNCNLWQDVKYLKPVVDDDPWLLFDFDDMDELEYGNGPTPSSRVGLLQSTGSSGVITAGHHVNLENGRVTLSELHFSELQKEMQGFRVKLQEKERVLEDLKETVSRMRKTLKNVIASDNKTVDLNSVPRCVGSVDVNDDEDYFSSYSHFEIHHEMLSDKVRTETYREAINLCAAGKKVMDLGCGTGILSMFAASTGADKVIAIDQSDIVYHAMDIIRENGMDQRIKVLKGRLEDTVLPEDCDKFDMIVSEWMGYFLLFEGMLDSVIYARDKHLKPGGLLLPNRCSISLTGFSSPDRYKELIGFWSDVYGYKMTCMKKEVVREALVEIVNDNERITDSCEVFTLDLMKATVDSVNFTSEFNLKVNRDGELTSIVGHFDVFFDLVKLVHFSTGSASIPTHWKQTVFFFKQPILVKQGETLSGKIVCQRHIKDVRSLSVTLIVKGFKQSFILD